MRVLTAGESHGPQLTAIIEGLPSGLFLTPEDINIPLGKRQEGHGRGGRMLIEKDQVQIVGGLRQGVTLGSPLALVIENRDWKNWSEIMSTFKNENADPKARFVSRPRPGHADLVGGMKYKHEDLRNVLERSSARETAMRVAVGAVAVKFLKELGIQITAHVTEIGGVALHNSTPMTVQEINENTKKSTVRCVCQDTSQKMIEKIDEAKAQGDTLGGIVEVVIENVPPGIGSYVHYDRKLDGKLAAAMMSIQAFKGVEVGVGFEVAHLPGSQIHDEIVWSKEEGFTRTSNRLGGLEGGMSNGMPIVVRGAMKPIPTLYKPLKSVDMKTKEVFEATVERSDACAVPAASVVAEHVLAFELANAILEQFGGDSMERLKGSFKAYCEEMRNA